MTGIASSKFWLKCLKRECYLPRRQSPFNNSSNLPWRAIVDGVDASPRGKFIHDYPFEITPVTDNAPFFFFTFKASTILHTLFPTSGQGSIAGTGRTISAWWFLGPCSSCSINCSFWFPRLTVGLAQNGAQTPITATAYFVALGLGFIVVEIALIQRFVLFLGHPTTQ